MPSCVDEEKLFPASKPVLCEEKSVNPYLEIKCCRSDYCNKFIRFELPERGEMKYIPNIKRHPNSKTIIQLFRNKKLFQSKK